MTADLSSEREMLSSSMTLRGYRPDDLDRLYELDVLCFEAPFRFSRVAMRRFAQASKARVAVAELAGEIAGFCILHLEPGPSGLAGYVVTLDVDPARRREGIAQALMAEVERLAVVEGCDTVLLHVFSGNTAAIAFYAAIGFRQIGWALNFYGRGRDAAVWSKSLAGVGESSAA